MLTIFYPDYYRVALYSKSVLNKGEHNSVSTFHKDLECKNTDYFELYWVRLFFRVYIQDVKIDFDCLHYKLVGFQKGHTRLPLNRTPSEKKASYPHNPSMFLPLHAPQPLVLLISYLKLAGQGRGVKASRGSIFCRPDTIAGEAVEHKQEGLQGPAHSSHEQNGEVQHRLRVSIHIHQITNILGGTKVLICIIKIAWESPMASRVVNTHMCVFSTGQMCLKNKEL